MSMRPDTSLIRSQARSEDGFTLIELLVVTIIVGILLTIAVPSYLGMRERASDSAAKSVIRSSIPAIEAYKTDNDTYVGVSPAALIATYGHDYSGIVIPTATTTAYCAQATVGAKTFSVSGPDGDVVAGAC